jgi:hypothetical protein
MIATKIVLEADDPVNFRLGKINGLGDERNRIFVHIRLSLLVLLGVPGVGVEPTRGVSLGGF